jgi:hypothetical protein
MDAFAVFRGAGSAASMGRDPSVFACARGASASIPRDTSDENQ